MTDYRALDARVRRAARRAGLAARRSRAGYSCDNLGGYRLVDPFVNTIVAGERFDMSAEEVIEYCRPDLGARRGV